MVELISLFALLLTAALFYLLVGVPLIERRSDLKTLAHRSKVGKNRRTRHVATPDAKKARSQRASGL